MTEMRFKLPFRSRNTHTHNNPTKSNFDRLRIKFEVYNNNNKNRFLKSRLGNTHLSGHN